jgi:hypothetical protein
MGRSESAEAKRVRVMGWDSWDMLAVRCGHCWERRRGRFRATCPRTDAERCEVVVAMWRSCFVMPSRQALFAFFDGVVVVVVARIVVHEFAWRCRKVLSIYNQSWTSWKVWLYLLVG